MRHVPAALLALLLLPPLLCPALARQQPAPSPVLVAAEQGMPLSLVPVTPVQEVPLTPLTPSPAAPAVPVQETPSPVAPAPSAQEAPAPPGAVPQEPAPVPQEQGASPSPSAVPGAAAPEEPPAPPPPPWLPRPSATLILLDKISAQPQTVTVPVGRSVTFESLTIGVRACDVHPPDVPAEATVLLDITDSHVGMPDFHGWIFASVPAASMFEHPLYDVRLAGCAG